MKVRFGRVDVNYYKRLEKYLFDDLNAVFIEGIRNENYVYGCYFVSNADSSKVDSVFNSLHFERIAIPSEYIGTPEQACEELEKAIEEKQKEIAEIEKQIRELMAKNAAKLRGAKRRLEELSTNFDVRKLAARIEEGELLSCLSTCLYQCFATFQYSIRVIFFGCYATDSSILSNLYAIRYHGFFTHSNQSKGIDRRF